MPAAIRIASIALCLLVPSVALAHRGLRPDVGGGGSGARAIDEDVGGLVGDSATMSAPVEGGRGAGARRRMPPVDPSLDVSELRAALQATRADLEQCMAASGLAGSLSVTARISLAHSLALDITTPHADAASHDCAELVLRRALTTMAARPITRALRSTLTVRRRAPRASVPVTPRPSGDLSAFEGPVHAAIERDRSAMIACLSSAAPGVVGNASLRVTLAPDGSLMLSSASLPTGVPAGPALPCLSGRIAQLRFAPAPPRAMVIEHSLPLGL